MDVRRHGGLLAASLVALALLALPGAGQAAEPGSRKALDEAAVVNTELALAYMKEGNLAAAREKIDKALQQNSRTAGTQMAAGFIYDQLNDKRKAATHYEQAVKLAGKDNPDVVANAAVFFCMNGDPKRGEQYMLQAAESPLNRRQDVAFANAGRCALGDGRPKEAEQNFRRALAINPKQPESLFQMAELTLAGGNGLQARAFLERYTAVAPVTPAALWLGRRIELGLGDAEQAARYAQRLKDEFPTSQETAQLFDAERTRP
jgi:type IV pilus assembly protein PilF